MPIDLVGERTLNDLLEDRVRAHGQRPFLVFEDADGAVSEWTYDGFASRTGALAAGLASLGVGREDKVVCLLPNSPTFVFLWFALARLGAVFVPANTASTAPEIDYIVEHSEAMSIVADAELAETAEDIGNGDLLRLTAHGVREGWRRLDDCLRTDVPPPQPSARPMDLAELLFTSGTTARPKAVMLTHANCLHSGERAARSLMLQPGERCLTALPLFHVNAQSFTLLAALTTGGTAIVLESFQARRYWSCVRSHEATQTSLVAMQLRTLLARPTEPTDADHSLRRVLYAINVTDEEKAAFESRFNVELCNGYGLTEAMTMVSVAPVVGPKRWPSIGLPASGRAVRLVDEEGHEVPTGTVGEIQVDGVPGRTVMLGYYRDPDATAAVLRDGWLSTGDTGYVDELGYLYFFDRRKDIIKRAGENVSAGEVERVLLEHSAVVEAAVVGVPDPLRDEAVKAYVVADGPLEEAQIVEHCRSRLASFKVPTLVEFRDALPKTSVGKIEKAVLRQESSRG
ncbi:MAG: AMP-binding protein [Propionibacteriales bacterium]|nr:AMP-binding protein [Propionibacteriales bacterium]